MFLPEIYMYMQLIHAAPRETPSDPKRNIAREAGESEDARRPTMRAPSDGNAHGRALRDPRPLAIPSRTSALSHPAPPLQNAREWDEWKSVRDVA